MYIHTSTHTCSYHGGLNLRTQTLVLSKALSKYQLRCQTKSRQKYKCVLLPWWWIYVYQPTSLPTCMWTVFGYAAKHTLMTHAVTFDVRECDPHAVKHKSWKHDQVLRSKWYKMKLHPGRLTWNLRIHPWRSQILFQTIIFGFYVNLWGCKWQPSTRTNSHIGSDVLYSSKKSYPNLSWYINMKISPMSPPETIHNTSDWFTLRKQEHA